MRDENTNDRKVEMLQNVSHFSYFLDRFILQMACFITIAKQSTLQIFWLYSVQLLAVLRVPQQCGCTQYSQ